MPSKTPTSPRSTPPTSCAEWKWDGIRVQAVAGTDEHGDIVARLYSRTGEDISKSFPDLLESLPAAGGDRRRIADHARWPRAVVQRPAAAPQSQSGDAEAHRRISRASARLRSAGRRRRRSARPALRRAPRAARSVHRRPRRSAHRHLAAGAVRDLGRVHRRARRSGRGRRRRRRRGGRGRDAQAPRRALSCPAGRRGRGGSGSAIR